MLRRYLERAGCGEVRVGIGRPYSSASAMGTGLIWSVKVVGLVLQALTFGRYIYPYASAIVAHGVKAAPGKC